MLKIDLNTEEVSCWGGIRYTEEEMKSIENMAMQLEAKAAEYKKQPPTPSNTFPDVIKFIRLSLQAFYMKFDGNIYGVLNISYIYRDREADFSNLEEEIYILYDMQNSETQSFSYKEYREKFDFLHAYIEWTPH
jgi:hypothetical protein